MKQELAALVGVDVRTPEGQKIFAYTLANMRAYARLKCKEQRKTCYDASKNGESIRNAPEPEM